MHCTVLSCAKQPFDCVPLSNNTVHRRLINISNNVKQMLLSDISQSRCPLILYEKNQEIHDGFLFCQPLLGHTTGEDIFNVMNNTDGGKSMIGINKELVPRIQNVALNVISTHCCIHREAWQHAICPLMYRKLWMKA
ncbi:hypothetical protein RI129_003480 [Pyrocoelia pectoralis]|uniref:Uncharacterized protein n=1 Tax=Pyrocoelia pectoralis TaxID=417401 RepID=A0AAN7VQJ6_9COLE